MDIEIKQENGSLLIKPLEKSIEAGNSRDFKSRIVDLINEGNSTIILNLSKVEFMDSSGLGTLISALKLLNSVSGKIIICEANDQVTKLFALTRLNQIFQFYPKQEEAINSLKISTK